MRKWNTRGKYEKQCSKVKSVRGREIEEAHGCWLTIPVSY